MTNQQHYSILAFICGATTPSNEGNLMIAAHLAVLFMIAIMGFLEPKEEKS